MPTVEFGSAMAAETLLRAAVLFKFEGGEDADVYVGSPPYAHALNQLLAGVVQEHRRSGNGRLADRWEGLYQLSGHDERRRFVRDYARRHPDWDTLSVDEREEWLATVAAPYRLTEGDLAFLLAPAA